MNRKKEKSKLWFILFLLFLMVIVVAAGKLFRQYIERQTSNDQFSSLQEEVNHEAGNMTEEPSMPDTKEKQTWEENTEDGAGEEDAKTDVLEEAGIEIPQKDLDWEKLHQENPDIYAWIYIPDTIVDYPVLQHPTDNKYYLNYNMDGTKGYPGCIYTENYNSKDFSDIHTVIYGHNLKDKTMFSSLHNFEDKELFGKDHYIFIYTEDYVFVYQIFAAYEFGAIHLLDNYDYTNEYVYEDYLKQIFGTADRIANVREDIAVTTEDKIVTLSTCTADHDSSRRFLVTGVLVNPKE